MLDYEILAYKIQYMRKDCNWWCEHITDSEESAVNYILENRKEWLNYRLIRYNVAVIDF